MKRLGWFLALVLTAGLLLAGCSGPQALPEDEAQAFAEQVAPMTENLLTGLSNGDEAAYLQDMSDKLRAASEGENFTGTQDAIIGKIGVYVSSEMVSVSKQDNFQIVVYKAKFENEDDVTMKVVYDISGTDLKIAGLWLTSPKLRGE